MENPHYKGKGQESGHQKESFFHEGIDMKFKPIHEQILEDST
jgi:hypothetical protein